MHSQRGNILFLILLAVVLFAALSYAMTGSQRGGVKDASSETIRSGVASLFQFFDQVDAAVLRMRLTGGFAPENISLQYTLKKADGTTQSVSSNSNCVGNACRVFLPDGGGATARGFENWALAPDGTGTTAPGYYNFIVFDFPYAGTSANDIILYVTKLQPAICTELNAALGITTTPTMTGSYLLATPTTNWDGAGYSISANASQLLGKNSFGRLVGSAPNQYCDVYHMLIAR